jgi:hypothetical protein
VKRPTVGSHPPARRSWSVWIITSLCLGLLAPTLALAQGTGVLEGQAVNGTAGGQAAAGLEVILRSLRGQEEGEQRSATTDAEGRFRFEGLEVGSDWAYLVRVGYQGVQYSPGVLAFESGQSELSTTVQVYEATTDAATVRAERAHVFVTLSGTGLEVTELYVFANSTDRTYVGAQEIDGRRWTTRFLTPKDGFNLAFDDGSLGARFLTTPQGGFVDTEPHWPGTTSVMFSYELACPSGNCDLTRKLLHPVSNLNVLIPDTGAAVDSAQLIMAGKQQAQGGSFLNYAGRDLASGQELDLRVRLPGAVSQPASSQGGGGTAALPWIILGTVLVGLALIYPFWRRRIEAAARESK